MLMWIRTATLFVFASISGAFAASESPEWSFDIKGQSGVLALEAIVVSPTLVIFMDSRFQSELQTPIPSYNLSQGLEMTLCRSIITRHGERCGTWKRVL
jgi:hypothetical protein